MECNGKTIRVFERGANKWNRIATRLHFESDMIAQIRTDNQHNTFQACQSTFTEWLGGKEGLRTPRTWSTVIAAIKEADLGQLADNLKEILLEKQSGKASPNETQGTFPMLKSMVPGTSSENSEKLQTRLYAESVSQTEKFGRMFNAFFRSLSDRNISIKK